MYTPSQRWSPEVPRPTNHLPVISESGCSTGERSKASVRVHPTPHAAGIRPRWGRNAYRLLVHRADRGRRRGYDSRSGRTGVGRVAADPTGIPASIDRDAPAEVDATPRSEEVVAEIENGIAISCMTYGGQLPWPPVRIRQGDTVAPAFESAESNSLPHSVDFHTSAGPGGGAEATMTAPGETADLRFRATSPGACIHHSAVPKVDIHISTETFGIILVEPPEVDHSLSRVVRKGCVAVVRAEGEERPEVLDAELTRPLRYLDRVPPPMPARRASATATSLIHARNGRARPVTP